MFKKSVILFLIFLLGTFLRLIHLNLIPNAIGGDELTYILGAKSIFLYGSDLTKSWNPLSVFIFNYPQGAVQAELPYFLNLPAVGPFPFSLFNARITTALFSIGIIPLMYFIALKLFKNARVALFAAFLTAINPWNIYIGRTAYEQAPATFFFLSALLGIIYFRGKYLLLSIPILALAFYSYIGTKVFFLPFVLISSWYSYYVVNKKKYKTEFIVIILFSLLLTAFFAFSIFLKQGENRTSDLILPNSSQISIQVDEIRRLTINNPFTGIFENKMGQYGRILVTKVFKTLSFDYLFVSGDQFFSITRHGLFYILDFVFLLIGVFALIRKSRVLSVFLFLLFLVSLIPQLVHRAETDNFTPHILFLFPVFILILSYGIDSVIEFSRKKSRFILASIVFVYLILLINFMQIYLYQFPNQGYFDFSARTLSSYSQRGPKNNQVVIYSPHTYSLAEKYSFYSNNLTGLSKKPYVFGNVTFTDCMDEINFKDRNVHIIDANCKSQVIEPEDKISLASLKDGGATFRIYGDTVCEGVALISYPRASRLKQFNVERLSNEEFCKTYAVRQ
jgi:4-amino-4-deoxy-L-arabinose transferase-like glycosyltransferase